MSLQVLYVLSTTQEEDPSRTGTTPFVNYQYQGQTLYRSMGRTGHVTVDGHVYT